MLCDFNILKNIGIEGPLFLASTISFLEPKLSSLVLIKMVIAQMMKHLLQLWEKIKINIYYNVKRVLQVKKKRKIEKKIVIEDITYFVVFIKNENVIVILYYDFFRA
jgi:hypothetical protein